MLIGEIIRIGGVGWLRVHRGQQSDLDTVWKRMSL
jgi:hypothetical protein